jgi:hypothetical protein
MRFKSGSVKGSPPVDGKGGDAGVRPAQRGRGLLQGVSDDQPRVRSAERVSNDVEPAAATGTVRVALPASLSVLAVVFHVFGSPTTWCFGRLAPAKCGSSSFQQISPWDATYRALRIPPVQSRGNPDIPSWDRPTMAPQPVRDIRHCGGSSGHRNATT